MGIPLRILIVEDNPLDAALVVRELQSGGFDPVAERVDSDRALRDALDGASWDIVVSDNSMPGFTGLDALDIVKKREEYIPFILVSGSMAEHAAVDAMRAGAQDYFVKGNLVRLCAAVERELRDASTRRKHRTNELSLREMHARFHAFMNNAPTPAWIKDHDLRYVYVNDAMAQFFGMATTSMMGRSDFDLMSNGAAQIARDNDHKMFELNRETHFQETIIDGESRVRILDITRFPLRGQAGRYVAGFAVDSTEQVRSHKQLEAAHQRLQSLSSRIIEVQERERRHLSRGLHDDIGQTLTALKINLETLNRDPAQAQAKLQESIGIVASVLEQMRTLSLELRPPQLDDLGLVAALRSYLERKAASAGLAGWFEGDELPSRAHPDVENTCFRIAQEAVTNILRHAQARNIWINLALQPAALHLCIRDDGRGFDVEAARRRSTRGESSGFFNMEERALLTGGHMEVMSRPGKGTEINVYLPFSAAANKGDMALSHRAAA